MTKQQLDTIKNVLSILDSCVLKQSTTIPECVALTKKLQEFAKVVKELEDNFTQPPQVEQKVIQSPESNTEVKKRMRKAKDEKSESGVE